MNDFFAVYFAISITFTIWVIWQGYLAEVIVLIPSWERATPFGMFAICFMSVGGLLFFGPVLIVWRLLCVRR